MFRKDVFPRLVLLGGGQNVERFYWVENIPESFGDVIYRLVYAVGSDWLYFP